MRRGMVAHGGSASYDSKVSYIQGYEGGYIDTQCKVDNTSQIDVGFTGENTLMLNVFGAYDSTSKRITLEPYQGGTITWNNQIWIWGNSSTPRTYTRAFISDNSAIIFYDNGQSFAKQNIYAAFSISNNLKLFNTTNSPNPQNNNMKVTYFKVWDTSTNTLLRDMFPVRVGQVGYMFDNVSGQLFGNANTLGGFNIGTDIT